MIRTGLLFQIAEPLRAQLLQGRGTCANSGSSILRSVMSTPESRPRRAVPVRWPGSRERKHVEAYQLPSFRRRRGYSAATALYAVSHQACRTCALFLVPRRSRSLSALEMLVARVDGRAIERGFLSLHFRVIVSLEVLQDLVASWFRKAAQIH